ncbi:hypothetical protein F8M41_009128 [Gigaspora margarita]|uniref:F-box domain-containing protein n=1 Tax=Gigaspora margarita TaxID=4874 RepID=A0A8H4AV84_GIGMA|nr:hypothetical protein F8M41_009128 [Gigaspora margarita]
MASKILMGDIPELMENIFDNLKNEYYSLYSCSLVNRYWCKISIPILWEDPFSFEQPFTPDNRLQNPSFISKYFSSLDEDEKFMLEEYVINPEFSKTLFDYTKFLKVLNLFCLEILVGEWIDLQLNDSKPPSDPSIYNITNLLLKLFIKNGASLRKLHLNFSDHTKILPETFYFLGQNVQFFSQIQELSLCIISDFSTEDAIGFLRILAANTTKISSLKFVEFYSHYDPQVYRALINIIKSQEQLLYFNIFDGEDFPEKNYHGIISALESQKNSLRELIIKHCICNEEFKVLKTSENLEILRIKYCTKLLTLSDYKLSTLEIVDRPIDASKIVLILEKSGTLLQRLKLESENEMILEQSLLLETLRSFCPNIIYLEILNFKFSSKFSDLISNLQNLQFLSLWCFWSIDDITPEQELVSQFAERLPLTLQYLDLRNSCLSSYTDILLNNCYSPLNKLLVDILHKEKQVKAIIEFCKRKKTLNYVGVNILVDKFRKELEEYVILRPRYRIVVNF